MSVSDKKILIIDDEEIIIRSLTKLLEQKGFDVISAQSGERARFLAESKNFDLIISDVRMPGLNGIETVGEINVILKEKGLNPPPVIFITGYADHDTEQEARKLNPIDYIFKPFDIVDLVNRIKVALEI